MKPEAVRAACLMFALVPSSATLHARPGGPAAAPGDGARRVEVGDAVVVTWTEEVDGVEVPFHRVELADGRTSGPRRSAVEIPMVRATFDPLVAPPDFSGSLLPDGGRLHLVQYVAAPLVAFREAIAGAGATWRRSAAAQTDLVEMDDEARAAVAVLPFVRWVGPYHPEYRLEPFLLEALAAGMLPPDLRVHVQVAERGPAQKEAVAAFVEAIGGRVVELHPDGFLLQAVLSPGQLAQVAARDEVVFVDRWFPVQTYMDKVRVDGGAAALANDTGLTGQGVRGEVLDLGCLLTHQDLQKNPVILHNGNSQTFYHGTQCTGIVFGTGAGSPSATGVMPDGQPIFSSVFNLGSRYVHTAQLLQPPFEACFQSNSWGLGFSQSYTNLTFEIDDVLFQNDLVILQAMANSGDQNADQFSWGKNVVSVGGIRHQDTQSVADDAWANAGSIGPAADGRIKPDLAYWYDSIRTTEEGGGYTNSFGGTSAATPETAGHFGLFFQMWHEEVLGNAAAGATVFASRPRAATARAVVINGADSYPFSGTGHDLTRTHQGWGRADVERLYDDRDRTFVVNESRPLKHLESVQYRLLVPAGAPELRATMVYLDPAGTTSAAQHRINDLTLKVTAPDGTTYWGNQGLRTGNASTPGGAPNTKDTVECVRVPGPAAGLWQVVVSADAVVQDAHVATPAVDAAFGLAVTGVEPSWTDLGSGLAGTFGEPELVGRGYLTPGEPFELSLTRVVGGAPTLFVVGQAAAGAPFLGGTLVPSADVVLSLSTPAAGGVHFNGVVPAGVAPGASLYLQAWVADAAAPQGAAASNALRALFS